MKLYLIHNEERGKCGGCNYGCTDFYVLSKTQEQAQLEFSEYELGLCGNCMCDYLFNEGFEIK